MLKPVKKTEVARTGGRFAIVASRYNAEYVDAMVRAAQSVFKRAEAKMRIVRVPGAFEIPAVASKLASKESRLSGIVCLGVIFQGQTSHAQHIGWGVTHALAQIQVQYKIPVIHGVFVFDKVKHAKVRCLGAEHNRGHEAAQTALEMARTMASLGR
ncbi:MAG TPA: 6,7-dimethyl-8-ribityllumazine synthase [Verrucomicrobiae bacterium]|nr:6,7-dimethyl-8-ribityllumazine synthase [Verrucomicrobiae bacterium]